MHGAITPLALARGAEGAEHVAAVGLGGLAPILDQMGVAGCFAHGAPFLLGHAHVGDAAVEGGFFLLTQSLFEVFGAAREDLVAAAAVAVLVAGDPAVGEADVEGGELGEDVAVAAVVEADPVDGGDAEGC